MDLKHCLISGLSADGNGNRRFAASGNPRQRTRSYDIVAPVKMKEFESCSSLRAFLYLVENEDGFAGNEAGGGPKVGGGHHDKLVHFQRTREYFFRIWILEEVHVHDVIVMRACKFARGKGFTALSAPLQDDGLATRISFPCRELTEHFSLKHGNPRFVMGNTTFPRDFLQNLQLFQGTFRPWRNFSQGLCIRRTLGSGAKRPAVLTPPASRQLQATPSRARRSDPAVRRSHLAPP